MTKIPKLFQWFLKKTKKQSEFVRWGFPSFGEAKEEEKSEFQKTSSDFEMAWADLSFASLIGKPQNDSFTFWVSSHNVQSSVLVDKLKKFAEVTHPAGSCVFQLSTIFRWDYEDSKNASPYRVYRFNFFDSVTGLTPQAIGDKVTHRMKEVKDIVEEYKVHS